jgi:hypothetical protein
MPFIIIIIINYYYYFASFLHYCHYSLLLLFSAITPLLPTYYAIIIIDSGQLTRGPSQGSEALHQGSGSGSRLQGLEWGLKIGLGSVNEIFRVSVVSNRVRSGQVENKQ